MKTFDKIDDSQSNGLNRDKNGNVWLCWFELTNEFFEKVQKLVTLSENEKKQFIWIQGNEGKINSGERTKIIHVKKM